MISRRARLVIGIIAVVLLAGVADRYIVGCGGPGAASASVPVGPAAW
jgi:hypothetical protein